MTERSGATVFFGRGLIAVGGLVAGLSGLCSGAVLALFVVEAASTVVRAPGQALELLMVPLVYGGAPMGFGGATVFLGRWLCGTTPHRPWTITAMAVGVAITAAAVYPAWRVLIHGPALASGHNTYFDPMGDPVTVPSALAGGVVLVAMAVMELRRRRSPAEASFE